MNPLQRVNHAMSLLAQGQLQQAAQISSQLLTESPGSAPAHYLACEVAIAQNHLDDATDHINKAVAAETENPQLLLKKADVEVMCRRGIQAQETASAAAELALYDVAVQIEAARIFSECGNHAGAEAFLLRAKEQEPNHPRLLFDFSTNQYFLGHMEAADQAISDYLELNPPVRGRKLLLRAQLKKQTPDNNHVDDLRNFLTGQLPDAEAVNAWFALARELEDIGEYERSFEALRSGAAIQRKLVNFSLAGEQRNISDLIETFQPERFNGIPDSAAVESPVFIVGLPRTGTTLVERIVSRKPGARSAEESYDFTLAFSAAINEHIAANQDRGLSPLSAALEVDYSEIAGNYISNMQGMLGEAECYIDKTPFNFLYCGLIRKAFPNARIVHLVRSPMDTCYAIYKTLFSKAYYYSYDLEELADYYIAYRRLMDHWTELMPGAILNVSYEQLVSDPLGTSRQIADFVGLEWSEQLVEVQDIDEAVSTASAGQVREPIYTSSVDLWRRYEAELDPLKQRLQAAGLVDEDGRATA